ncbi:MAG TPA: alginate lyase family protein [Stellaceae bacterium]|nr:alginate lyase family protein [Stellaceae bacterium]
MKLGWYIHRLARMSPTEMTQRAVTEGKHRLWRSKAANDTAPILDTTPRVALHRRLAAPSSPDSELARAALAAADRLSQGQWRVLSVARDDFSPETDWFADPLTGRRAPADMFCFDVPYRDETVVGNIKYLWEPSRQHHVTLLAAAYRLSGDERYAALAARFLESWWRANPFLKGVHWTSAIEVGIRLLSWSWARVLLADWPGVGAVFEENPLFQTQLYNHQRYVVNFRSRGSSANNHVIAEMAGLAASASVFPWLEDSADWAQLAWSALATEATRQTFADGLNREQASDYHAFVFELVLAAAMIGGLSGRKIDGAIAGALRAMADAAAATLDSAGRAPRMGDGDDGRGLVVDDPEAERWPILLEAADRLFGRAAWWPAQAAGSVLADIAESARDQMPVLGPARPLRRPHLFPQAGQSFLRSFDAAPEIWCRFDHGPHGYLAIAAHGHADALSIELRVGGVELLADPGTYCYHGETEWRRYFRSTRGHNALVIDGEDQARQAGPFLWRDLPDTRLMSHDGLDGGATPRVVAVHGGYLRLADPLRVFRAVMLDRAERVFEIADWIEASQTHDAALAFHLGPSVACRLTGTTALLEWPQGRATLTLPDALAWQTHRGEVDPPLGWYSPRFGEKVPSTVLIGTGTLAPEQRLISRLAL